MIESGDVQACVDKIALKALGKDPISVTTYYLATAINIHEKKIIQLATIINNQAKVIEELKEDIKTLSPKIIV